MSEVVAAARDWIGTPYMHQASLKGVGCDCLGLLRGIWREVLGTEPEVVPPYTPDWGEAQGVEMLLQAAGRHLVPVTARAPGDVLVFRMRRAAVAKHIGILSAADAFIHAYSRHGVVESPLSDAWSARIAGTFRLPG